MKILFLNTFYAPNTIGGTEAVLQGIVEGVADRGIEVVVLATSQQKGLHQETVNGVRVWRVGIRNLFWPSPAVPRTLSSQALWHLIDTYNPAMGEVLEKVLKIERPTVASVHNLAGWSASAWSAFLKAKVPVVQVLHDHYLLCPRTTMFKNGRSCIGQCASCRVLRLSHGTLSRSVSGVVGVSRYILARHRQEGLFHGVPRQSVIYNARRPSDLCLEGRLLDHPTIKRREGRVRFGFIGALHPGKGVEDLIRAFLKGAPSASELWIAGAGRKDYEETLRRLSQGAPVRFTGRMRPDDFYPYIDVVVAPSRWNETFSLVVMEAMSYGKSVIATAVGGIPELVGDNKTGLLVGPGRIEELSQALRKIAGSPDLRESFGSLGKERSAFFLDHEGFVEKHLQVLRLVAHDGL